MGPAGEFGYKGQKGEPARDSVALKGRKVNVFNSHIFMNRVIFVEKNNAIFLILSIA